MISGRNQAEFTQKIVTEMARENLDAVILTAPDAIFYATGYASSFLYNSFNYGLTVLIINKDGRMAMVLSEFERQSAARVTKDIDLITYPTWIYIEDYAVPGQVKDVQPDVNKTYKAALAWLPEQAGPRRIGVQYDYIKFATWEYLNTVFPRENLIDVKELLVNARSVKTQWEINVMREAARISEVAMLRTARETVAGMTDAEVSILFRNHCQELSTEVVEVSQAHTFGENFAPAKIQTDKVLRRGDIVRLDGGPTLAGYNSDIARSYAVGGITSSENEELYEQLWKGRRAAQALLGPGVPRCQIFHAAQDAIHAAGLTGYTRGHHGHSLGCASFGEEYPFIAPNDERPFEPGNVFCLEIPYYSSRHHSYNIEDTFLITEDGVEFFTNAVDSLYL